MDNKENHQTMEGKRDKIYKTIQHSTNHQVKDNLAQRFTYLKNEIQKIWVNYWNYTDNVILVTIENTYTRKKSKQEEICIRNIRGEAKLVAKFKHKPKLIINTKGRTTVVKVVKIVIVIKIYLSQFLLMWIILR